MGLAVSFNEFFKRDKRCNASNISRKINTFQPDSSGAENQHTRRDKYEYA